MKTKITALLLVIAISFGMTACSNKNHLGGSTGSSDSSVSETTSPEKNSSAGSSTSADPEEIFEESSENTETPQDPLTADQLSMNSFPYSVGEKIIEKAICYTLTLKNNSPYPILFTEILYKTKDNVSDKSLKLFDDFKKRHKKYISQEEDNRNILLIGTSEAYVKPGQYLKDVPVTIGMHSMTWYDAPNYDQFVLMRPDTLTLGLVRDDLLYRCQYDFVSKTWSVEDAPVALNNWPSTELTALIPKPSCDYYRVTTKKDDDYLGFTAYGISVEDFNAYVEQVRDAGFTRNKDSGKRYYSAEDSKKNAIDILYDESAWNMEVDLNL